jgi:hypothetical protein
MIAIAWGKQPDAPRPKPLTRAERAERYRKTANGKATVAKALNRRKTDENKEALAMRERGRHWRKKLAESPPRDPLLDAMMGIRPHQPPPCPPCGSH